MLGVSNGKIVTGQGQTVRLRGTCIGGWMNMENFITGYPGAEHDLRDVAAEVLGSDQAQYVFDSMLDHFFTKDDVAFIKAQGANVIRLPLNYRHFESDAKPFEYLKGGFQRLDRAIDWCARHGLYVILDRHAVPGYQSADRHCDNSSRRSMFWTHAHFQDRLVALWEQLASRYRDQATVAGYDVMNEPVTNPHHGVCPREYRPRWDVLNAFYRRVVKAIRAVDQNHIIFLEGDLWSQRFRGLDDQTDVFEEFGAHWTQWNYKDTGVQGWVVIEADSPYLRLVRPALDKVTPMMDLASGDKGKLVKSKIAELARLIEQQIDPAIQPTGLLEFSVLDNYADLRIQPLWARCFNDLGRSDIDRTMESFRLRNCRRHPLIEVLKKHFARPA